MIQLEVQSPFNKRFSIASSIPLGQKGLVHIWGRNDLSTPQNLGIHWVIKDPSGVVVEDYGGWKATVLGAGLTHEFIGGRFNLDKEGSYTLDVKLFMNLDNPNVVDSYSGALCTVGVPPECSIDSDCPEGYICVDGKCVLALPETCSIDSDCPEGYVCVDGKCVKEEKAFPWLPVVLIGGAALVVAATAKPKGSKGLTKTK